MEKRVLFLQLFQEFIWWIITAAIVVAVLYPISSKINYNYTLINTLFIVVAITYFRYFFFLNTLFYLKNRWLRFSLFSLNFVLWIFLINRFQFLMHTIDISDLTYFGITKSALVIDEQIRLLDYIYRELSFSGVCALLAIILFNLRLVGAYWRVATKRFSTRMQA